MDKQFYNTYSISDSDNDSVILVEHQTDQTNKNDHPSSPEEPDFFQQVLRQQKRKKSPSPKKTFHYEEDTCLIQNNVIPNELQNVLCHIEDPKSHVYESTKQKIVESYNKNMLNSDIHKIMNEDPITEMVEPKRKKRLTKEEMEERKKEEMARKNMKKKLAEELKRLHPKECMKFITVHIDVNLQNHDYSEQILCEIRSTDAKYKIESNSIVSHSVTWSRQISDTVSEDENFMLLIWNYESVKNLIMINQLSEKLNHLKLLKKQLSIIIYSTADQLRKTKSKKGQSERSNMLNSLNQMMLNCNISFRFIENKKDVALAILYFTKSVAQKPFKLNKYKEEQDGCDWYASGHTKNCITIDKNGTGLTQLWRQMLSQFPLCTLEASEAIASVYKSPINLLEAYDKCSSRLEGEILLQDIPVRRGFGPLASIRRIGPELSKKIYTFFTDDTGCTTLSQEE